VLENSEIELEGDDFGLKTLELKLDEGSVLET
jgi:hypothetical protein